MVGLDAEGLFQPQGFYDYLLRGADSAARPPCRLSSTHPIDRSDGEVVGRRALIAVQRLHSAQLPRVLVDAELRGDNADDARANGVGKGAKRAAVCICGCHLDEGRHHMNRATVTRPPARHSPSPRPQPNAVSVLPLAPLGPHPRPRSTDVT